MNKVQTETLSMMDSLVAFNDENIEITGLIPALAESYVELRGICNSIHSKRKLQDAATKGHTTNKDNNKETLCVVANEVAAVVYAWAHDVNDSVVMAKVKTNLSKLRDLGIGKLADTCMLYYDIALANQKELAKYGISDLDLDTFLNTITNYRSAVPSNRNAVSDRKAYRAEIEVMFKRGKVLLRNKIDKLTLKLKKAHPGYHSRYKSNREIINKGSRTTAFRISVMDAKTGEPIVGASVAIAALDLQLTSNKQGLVMAKPVAIGLYNLVVKKDGYATESLTEVKAVQGKTNRVDVMMKNV